MYEILLVVRKILIVPEGGSFMLINAKTTNTAQNEDDIEIGEGLNLSITSGYQPEGNINIGMIFIFLSFYKFLSQLTPP